MPERVIEADRTRGAAVAIRMMEVAIRDGAKLSGIPQLYPTKDETTHVEARYSL